MDIRTTNHKPQNSIIETTTAETKAKTKVTDPRNIRNVCLVGHTDHGKSTIVDCLLVKAGLISASEIGTRATDATEEEQKRQLTIKSNSVLLQLQTAESDRPLISKTDAGDPNVDDVLVNLIDTPGITDFSAEVASSLRVTDGAVIVVDIVEGVCMQTEHSIKQAVLERIKPAAFVNKLDTAFVELSMENEDIYLTLKHIVDDLNVSISMNYDNSIMMKDEDLLIDPTSGCVAFGSALQGWAFTIRDFANFYASIFKSPAEKIINKLWGDHFFHSQSRKWLTTKEPDSERGFNVFILEPIKKLSDAILHSKETETEEFLKSLNIELSQEEAAMESKELLKLVMTKWLPAADALMHIITVHLPSPVTAQRYRTEFLYDGHQDDVFNGILDCDMNGPFIMYVSKMVPSSIKGRCYAFGRIFSGQLTSGQKVRVLGSSEQEEIVETCVEGVGIMMSKTFQPMESMAAGNLCAVDGIDDVLIKSATLTTLKNSYRIKPVKLRMEPVVRLVIEPEEPPDLPKVIEGIRRVSKLDSLLQTYTSEAGQCIIAGSGELHLEICFKELQDTADGGLKLRDSEPFAACRETIASISSQLCSATSPNRLNHFYMEASPLSNELCEDIDSCSLCISENPKVVRSFLMEKHGFSEEDATNIWTFGPGYSGPNLLLNKTKGSEHLDEIQPLCITAFQSAAQSGALCNEPMRGIGFHLSCVELHADSNCRTPAQILPAVRRLIYSSELTASPRIVQPIYLCEIIATPDSVSSVHEVITTCSGHVCEEKSIHNNPLMIIKAYIPVDKTFGFSSTLRHLTSGKAFPQCFFDHWEILPGDPTDNSPNNDAFSFVTNVRRRKGLNEEVPHAFVFTDQI